VQREYHISQKNKITFALTRSVHQNEKTDKTMLLLSSSQMMIAERCDSAFIIVHRYQSHHEDDLHEDKAHMPHNRRVLK